MNNVSRQRRVIEGVLNRHYTNLTWIPLINKMIDYLWKLNLFVKVHFTTTPHYYNSITSPFQRRIVYFISHPCHLMNPTTAIDCQSINTDDWTPLNHSSNLHLFAWGCILSSLPIKHSHVSSHLSISVFDFRFDIIPSYLLEMRAQFLLLILLSTRYEDIYLYIYLSIYQVMKETQVTFRVIDEPGRAANPWRVILNQSP